MNERERHVLTVNFCTIIDKLQVEPVLDYLYQNNLLKDHHLRQILAEKSYDRTRVLILHLKRGGPRTFQLFIDSLIHTDQTELAGLLNVAQ